MARLPRLTSKEAEQGLLQAGFEMVRSKGSHRIYVKGNRRIVIPFYAGKALHPKIAAQVMRCVEEAT